MKDKTIPYYWGIIISFVFAILIIISYFAGSRIKKYKLDAEINKAKIESLEKKLDEKNKELNNLKTKYKQEINEAHNMSDSDAVVLFQQLLSN